MNTVTLRRASLRRLLLVALTLLGAALLTGCSDADWDLLSTMAEDWATDNGVWDGENLNVGRLARVGVEQQIDEIFNGPPPELAAAQVVEDIRVADNWADAGARRGGEEGLANIETAIAMRPDDWAYWEQKGALLLAQGRAVEAQAAFDHSNNLARQHVLGGGGDCKTYTRNVLAQREQALMTQTDRMYNSGQQPPAEVTNRLENVRTELALLDTAAGACE